jgi:chorismate synthase
MSANSFGHLFKLTTFGESHGLAIGGIIEGMPSKVFFDEPLLIENMNRRRPGQSELVSDRKETDQVEFLSGIHKGKTLGTPIAFHIRNIDARSQDYAHRPPRVGHADDMWLGKFGISDARGGGRASGRETATRVVGGSLAEMYCRTQHPEIKIVGFVSTLGPFALGDEEYRQAIEKIHREDIEKSQTRFPAQNDVQEKVRDLLLRAKQSGESYGGIVSIVVRNIPTGLGQPVFHKLKADLASAMLSIGAVVGFELGEGLSGTQAKGTDFHARNPYGGIRGGISTGENIYFRTAFKPTSTLGEMAKTGRHDPCIVPRAVAVCEAMTWMVVADHLLWRKLDRIEQKTH